jgi:hypothetical protein
LNLRGVAIRISLLAQIHAGALNDPFAVQHPFC